MGKYEYLLGENEKLLKLFEAHLLKTGLSGKAVREHKSNIELLINDYLAANRVSPEKANKYDIADFLDWCIDKWVFNRVSGLILTLASIKLFFEYLKGKGIAKNISGILEICAQSSYYAAKFSKHEKLLEGY
ncbi:MAG: hypothetical protein QME12_02010 [Nanoarchaeota archaeon]|nr:hypothetical protein [Nanoarchaeota archaeon]